MKVDVTKVLVTGSSGFLGSSLVMSLSGFERFDVTGVSRKSVSAQHSKHVMIGDINNQTEWGAALRGKDVVVHTAARAHIMKNESLDPISEYRLVNVEGTVNLAKQAASSGVKRFVFISSIKVNGEQTRPGHPFTVNDVPNPQDDYGLSKWEAEQGLKNIAEETNMDVVIIRPPLIYGPQAKGNFASLLRMVETGMPLPLGCLGNARSLVALDNLIDLIITCIDHPNAANQLFLISDGQDLSTSELLDKLAVAMCKPSRLLPIPSSIISFTAHLLGKQQVADRLLGSLQVDITNTKALLGWSPLVTVEEGLKRCVSQS